MTPKPPGLLLYALQTASVNLRHTDIDPIAEKVVLDPRRARDAPLDADQWSEDDLDDEEEDDEEEEEKEEQLGQKEVKPAAPAKPAQPPVPKKRIPGPGRTRTTRCQSTARSRQLRHPKLRPTFANSWSKCARNQKPERL